MIRALYTLKYLATLMYNSSLLMLCTSWFKTLNKVVNSKYKQYTNDEKYFRSFTRMESVRMYFEIETVSDLVKLFVCRRTLNVFLLLYFFNDLLFYNSYLDLIMMFSQRRTSAFFNISFHSFFKPYFVNIFKVTVSSFFQSYFVKILKVSVSKRCFLFVATTA